MTTTTHNKKTWTKSLFVNVFNNEFFGRPFFLFLLSMEQNKQKKTEKKAKKRK